MLPTTLQVRSILNTELKSNGIKPIHTYTDNARTKGKARRYITYVISDQIPNPFIEEIVAECNKKEPLAKFRMTHPIPAINNRYPANNTYIRATARIEK